MQLVTVCRSAHCYNFVAQVFSDCEVNADFLEFSKWLKSIMVLGHGYGNWAGPQIRLAVGCAELTESFESASNGYSTVLRKLFL